MAQIEYWHPVLLSKELPSSKAVGIKLAENEIALFRPGPGCVAAIDDKCVHRRMRLSLGKVVNERLQCVYHGWTFAKDGQGESPGTPKLFACAPSYDVREAHDLIWVKSRGPSKLPGSWLVRLLMGYKPWMWFHSDYTFYYDPPRVVIDHWWADPSCEARQAFMRYRVHQFFVPIDATSTHLFTLIFGLAKYPLPMGGGMGLARWLVRSKTKAELDADVWLCSNLADKDPKIEGMKLSRFDRTMGLNRDRLKQIYYA